MSGTILPSGETVSVTPEEILKYLNPDGLRQIFRQDRLKWNLKVNKDCDYYDNMNMYKFSGNMHNDAYYQRMEIRTFPDNGAYAGYAGINIDSGIFGIVHNVDKWDHGISQESLKEITNRVQIGVSAIIPSKSGYGYNDNGDMDLNTSNRHASILFDPYDGRGYLFSNDSPNYVNNEDRSIDDKLPLRTIARVGDIPTRMTDLKNDLDFVADVDYHHTDNNFTNSHRFLLDNLDDRTFVYPEICKDVNGNYITNERIGLSGSMIYDECDVPGKVNTQPDLGENPELNVFGDRNNEANNSYNINSDFSGVYNQSGFLPGVFRSYEELCRVDLVDQLRLQKTHNISPGAKRSESYYILDGVWSPNWFDRLTYNDSYLAQSLYPTNMEEIYEDREPQPYTKLHSGDTNELYQWRYNRLSVTYLSEDIHITIKNAGVLYEVGDILKWTFADDVIDYKVTRVGDNGEIITGEYTYEYARVFEQDPSTHGVGIPFSNSSGVGNGATLIISCNHHISSHASQLKNNLYAYVDIVPSVRSDNTTAWSDINDSDDQDGIINIRSTAAGPAYSGINSGRGGPGVSDPSSENVFHEHGGNATAGVHLHLFRYVIETENPVWVIRNGIQVFLGKWVDQGPMGVERPCDIKALLLSNPDTNNFNNYYKFMIDSYFDGISGSPDSVVTNNSNTYSAAYLHVAQTDPGKDQKFTAKQLNADTSKYEEIDITDKILYINAATGVMFSYNAEYKYDANYGYGSRQPGWYPLAGAITK